MRLNPLLLEAIRRASERQHETPPRAASQVTEAARDLFRISVVFRDNRPLLHIPDATLLWREADDLVIRTEGHTWRLPWGSVEDVKIQGLGP